MNGQACIHALSGAALALAAALLTGCGKAPATADAATAPPAPTAAQPGRTSAADQQPADRSSSSATTGRRGELSNPDASSVVFLYHSLSGIAPPLDQWVEDDSRVRNATGAGRAAQRELVRAELEAGLAAVRDIGFIRLALNDTLSEYDPTYGEYTLRALAPSSTVSYRALQQEISLRFGNGRDAQTWAVPADQTQGIDDSFRFGRAVTLDLLLQVTGVQPAPRGGTLVAEVLEYEIRTQQGDKLLGRVRPASPAP